MPEESLTEIKPLQMIADLGIEFDSIVKWDNGALLCRNIPGTDERENIGAMGMGKDHWGGLSWPMVVRMHDQIVFKTPKGSTIGVVFGITLSFKGRKGIIGVSVGGDTDGGFGESGIKVRMEDIVGNLSIQEKMAELYPR
jgi:hypothetical protein